MAATHGARPVFRLNPRHQELVRAKINSGMIIERLHSHIAGELELSPTQLGACKLLLDKALSNPPSLAPAPDDDTGAPISRYSLSLDQLRRIAAGEPLEGEFRQLPAPESRAECPESGVKVYNPTGPETAQERAGEATSSGNSEGRGPTGGP